MISIETSLWTPGLQTSPAVVVDEQTGLVTDTLEHGVLEDIVDRDGVLNHEGLQYFGFNRSKYFDGDAPEQLSRLPSITFRGGSQLMKDDIYLGGSQKSIDGSIKQAELSFLQEVLSEIFDGRNDLRDVDLQGLLSVDSGMAQTLRSLFINRPGTNGGRSSLRHIFKGDKYGGLHVPAFASELVEVSEDEIDPLEPFEAVISINGLSRLKLVDDGTPRLEPATTSMFPRKFDSLTVLQCVIDAWQHRRDWQSVRVNNRGDASAIYEVTVSLDDVVKPMKIRLVTDNDPYQEKIKTAFPVTREK